MSDVKQILRAKYQARTARYRASEKYRQTLKAYEARPEVIAYRRAYDAMRCARLKAQRLATRIGGGG